MVLSSHDVAVGVKVPGRTRGRKMNSNPAWRSVRVRRIKRHVNGSTAISSRRRIRRSLRTRNPGEAISWWHVHAAGGHPALRRPSRLTRLPHNLACESTVHLATNLLRPRDRSAVEARQVHKAVTLGNAIVELRH